MSRWNSKAQPAVAYQVAEEAPNGLEELYKTTPHATHSCLVFPLRYPLAVIKRQVQVSQY